MTDKHWITSSRRRDGLTVQTCHLATPVVTQVSVVHVNEPAVPGAARGGCSSTQRRVYTQDTLQYTATFPLQDRCTV